MPPYVCSIYFLLRVKKSLVSRLAHLYKLKLRLALEENEDEHMLIYALVKMSIQYF
jgi:hypothetical protein